jgi:N-acetylmuramoyl-L-alanine amidase
MSTVAVKAHRLTVDGAAVAYRASPNRGGTLAPEGIIVHDTAGDLAGTGSVDWLCNKAAKASAHLVVHRDGRVTQLVPFNVVAWHAGVSAWRGRPNCNGFSVGIEIVNPGKLVRTADHGGWRTSFGAGIPKNDDHVVEWFNSTVHGEGGWLLYTERQLTAVTAIVRALRAAYPAIAWLAPHWEVSPGRKVDTGPQFPLAALREVALGDSKAMTNADGTNAITTVGVNQRRWPSLNDNILRVLPAATRVAVVRKGVFETRGAMEHWFLVDAAGLGEGWVHGAYLDLD